MEKDQQSQKASEDVSTYDGATLSHANNPTMEVPFLVVICLNFAQFTGEVDRPSL